MTNNLDEIPIEYIQIGERYREDLGDLTELKESLSTKGQIQTIAVERVLTQEGEFLEYALLGGGRRIAAMKELGWEKGVILTSETGKVRVNSCLIFYKEDD